MNDIKSSLDGAFTKYLQRADRSRERTVSFSAKSAALNEAQVQHPAAPRQFQIQNAIRPLFGKGAPKQAVIGDHPDFAYLKATNDVEYHEIATLFMDIESSTRMALLLNLDEVFKIKNAFICAAIEIVQAFDGHVHRIMGDSVMAFFGGRGVAKDQPMIDALNGASMLRYFAEKVVIPQLKDAHAIESLGIRIGVDYGSAGKVLWSSYGYPGTSEVTATSFYVDVAAKLQHNASRNEILVGQSIKDTLDFPDELLGVKQSAGAPDPFVLPNHTDESGKPMNYRKFAVKWDEYLNCSNFSRAVKDLTSIQNRMPDATELRVFLSLDRTFSAPKEYFPCSSAVTKGEWIKFSLRLSLQPPIGTKIRFAVENHGREAATHENSHNHFTDYTVERYGQTTFDHVEHCGYRGLHYMTITFSPPNGAPTWKQRLGVYVA